MSAPVLTPEQVAEAMKSLDDVPWEHFQELGASHEALREHLRVAEQDLQQYRARCEQECIIGHDQGAPELCRIVKERDDLSAARDAALRDNETLRHHLTVVLPMALGYAAAHPVGRNQEMCDNARAAGAALAAPAPSEPTTGGNDA